MKLDTEKITFTLRSDGVVQIECKPHTILDIEEARLSTTMVHNLVGDEPKPLLCDLTNVVKMTQACRNHFAGKGHAQVFTRCALIINNPISKIIGNFFLGANKPFRPTRLFTNMDEGVKWLKEG